MSSETQAAEETRESGVEAARDLEICTELSPPDEGRAEAEAVALEERADNLRVRSVRTGGPVAEMAVEVHKRWEAGKRLKVRFVDGNPSVQQRVGQRRQGMGAARERQARLRHACGRGDPDLVHARRLVVGRWDRRSLLRRQ